MKLHFGRGKGVVHCLFQQFKHIRLGNSGHRSEGFKAGRSQQGHLVTLLPTFIDHRSEAGPGLPGGYEGIHPGWAMIRSHVP